MEVCDGYRDHLQIVNMLEEPNKVDCHCKCLHILQTKGKIKVEEWPAVVYAARYGHDTCLQAIIDAGADVNTRGKQGYTALICAAQFGNDKCLEILFKSGADVNLKKQHGYSALHYASNGSKLYHVKCVHSLVQAGADVNIASYTGITPLMIAAGCTSNDDCVNMLIKPGADVNASDHYWENSLVTAVQRGTKDNVKILIAEGANVDSVAGNYLTPLMYAIKRDKFVHILINCGADVNYIPDWYDSWSPVTYSHFLDISRV